MLHLCARMLLEDSYAGRLGLRPEDAGGHVTVKPRTLVQRAQFQRCKRDSIAFYMLL